MRAAITRIGRTEDVVFAPGGDRLALLGLNSNSLLLLDVEFDRAGEGPRIRLTAWREVLSASFNMPHGAAWIDSRTLAIANRRGSLAIIELPEDFPAGTRVELEALRTIGGDGSDLVKTPGSLVARTLGFGIVELLVCNNYVHYVTRHLLDQRSRYDVLSSEILISEGVAVPDGVALSSSGEWIAVSNHDGRTVLLFRDDGVAIPKRAPDGVMTGLHCPHGLRFVGDGRNLLVADAAAPFVHIYRSEDGDWTGERAPAESIRVLDDASFARGNHSPLEGGPKGLDLTGDNRVMVVSCEEQPLAFFDLSSLLPMQDGEDPQRCALGPEGARDALVRSLRRSRLAAEQQAEALRRTDAFDRSAVIERENEIRALLGSRSWRLTAPLRTLNKGAKHLRRRLAGDRSSR